LVRSFTNYGWGRLGKQAVVYYFEMLFPDFLGEYYINHEAPVRIITFQVTTLKYKAGWLHNTLSQLVFMKQSEDPRRRYLSVSSKPLR
jgi:hypothetical protein